MFSSPSARSLIVAALWAVSLTYPFVVYFSLHRIGPSLIIVGLLALLGLRLLVARAGERRTLVPHLLVAAGILCFGFWAPTLGMKAYPILVNLALAGTFALSLLYPPSAIERIARIREPDLPPAGVAYTRKVTVVWTAFFLINAAISGWTAVAGSLETWTLYNGLVAYLAIGALFAAEYAVRLMLRRRLRRPT